MRGDLALELTDSPAALVDAVIACRREPVDHGAPAVLLLLALAEHDRRSGHAPDERVRRDLGERRIAHARERALGVLQLRAEHVGDEPAQAVAIDLVRQIAGAVAAPVCVAVAGPLVSVERDLAAHDLVLATADLTGPLGRLRPAGLARRFPLGRLCRSLGGLRSFAGERALAPGTILRPNRRGALAAELGVTLLVRRREFAPPGDERRRGDQGADLVADLLRRATAGRGGHRRRRLRLAHASTLVPEPLDHRRRRAPAGGFCDRADLVVDHLHRARAPRIRARVRLDRAGRLVRDADQDRRTGQGGHDLGLELAA